MKIEKAEVVIITNAVDTIYLTFVNDDGTQMPSPIPFYPNKCLKVKFEAELDNGVKYCKNVLMIEPEVIDTRKYGL